MIRRAAKSIQKALSRVPLIHRALRAVWVPPQRIYQHLYFRGTFDVEIPGHGRFELETLGGEAENELFWRGFAETWERRSLRIWCHLARTANCIVDVGANSGIYSLAAQVVNPSAKVIALEPSRRVFELLSRNIRRNSLPIEPLEVAASDVSGTATLFDTPDAFQTGASLVAPPEARVERYDVRVERLDSIVEGRCPAGVDLLKIDVEMHEATVLRGMQRTLEESSPRMLVEVLTDELGAEIEEILKGFGYVFVPIDEDAGAADSTPETSRNVLICRPEVLDDLRSSFPDLRPVAHLARPSFVQRAAATR